MAVARFDALRTVAAGSITGSYAALGAPMAYNMRILKITNSTDGNLFISFDGTTDNDFVTAGGFVLYDFSTNANNVSNSDSFVLATNTQLYVKYSSVPSTGAVWATGIYARGV
jgi:hypothetical protein